MGDRRIINLPETAGPSPDSYLMIDGATHGASKIRVGSVLGPSRYTFLTKAEADAAVAGFADYATAEIDDPNPTLNGVYRKDPTSHAWVKFDNSSYSNLNAAIQANTGNVSSNARRQHLNLFNSRLRVATVGDSIYQGAHTAYADGSSINTNSRAMNWAHAVYPYFDYDVWVDLANTVHYYSGLNNNYSGSWTSGGPPTGLVPNNQGALERIGDILPYTPDVVIEESGINSVTNGVSSATIISQKQSIIAALQAAGVKTIILRTMTPVSSAQVPDGSPQRTVLADVNSWIRTYSANNAPHILLLDAYAIFDDPGNPGHPRAGYTFDGLHPTSLGSQHEATDTGGLVTLFQKIIKPLPTRYADLFNLLPNIGGITGSLGTTNVTGQVSTGYKAQWISGGPGTTAACGIGTDAYGRLYQQIDFTTHGGNSAELFGFTALNSIDLTPLARRWIRARYRVLLLPSLMWRGVQVLGGNIGGMNPLNTDTLINTGWQLDIETPPYLLGASPGSVTPQLWINVDGSTSGVTGTARISCCEYYEVDNARGLHNTLGG